MTSVVNNNNSIGREELTELTRVNNNSNNNIPPISQLNNLNHEEIEIENNQNNVINRNNNNNNNNNNIQELSNLSQLNIQDNNSNGNRWNFSDYWIRNNSTSLMSLSSSSKTDTLDIRATTAAEKSSTGKRQKYKKTVYKRNAYITGSKPYPIDNKIEDINYDKLSIDDPRASNIRIENRNSNFIFMPSIERFSAHTGICQIIGSRTVKGDYHQLHVGDIIRFGSVGFLISEINTNNEGKSDGSMTTNEIQSLLHRVVCQDDDARDLDSLDDDTTSVTNHTGHFDNDNDDDNENILKLKQLEEKKQNSKRTTDACVCYICYDSGTEDDPLISPCKCSGDTKYIHLNCLKKWNTSTEKNEICTILDENENRKCSICQSVYPPRTKLPNGKTVSLLPDKLKSPSMILVLITKHSSSSLITNTRYQLSMNNLLKAIPKRPLRIGRSSQCDLVLKYRTVSTIHAEMIYTKGEFYLTDLSSSNGTLKYLYHPTNIEAGKLLHVKFGRTVISLKAFKRIRLPALFAGMITSRSSNSSDDESTNTNINATHAHSLHSQQINHTTNENNTITSMHLPSSTSPQSQANQPQRSPVTHRASLSLAGWISNTTSSLQRVSSVPHAISSPTDITSNNR